MKTISQTISVLIFVGLVTAGFALAEKAPEEEPQEVSVGVVRPTVPMPTPPKAPKVPHLIFGPLTSTRQELQARIARFVAAETALVIPTTETIKQNPDFVEATVKDLNIMCRIFDKELKISDRVRELYNLALFSDSFEDFFDQHHFFGQEIHGAKGIYLDGYGALFQIEVSFPLSAPPQAAEQEKKIEEGGDPVWIQAERELYSPEKLKKKAKKPDPTKEYDAEKVEDLKRKLVETLKQTANIGSLKADESVIISVTGRHSAENPTKVLIIRAKKPDLDAFAKGELDFDRFSQKVQMLMY